MMDRYLIKAEHSIHASMGFLLCMKGFYISRAFIFHANKENYCWQKRQFDSFIQAAV